MSMSTYRLLTGRFFVRFDEKQNHEQPQPDGDTIRFIPDNPFVVNDKELFPRMGFGNPDMGEFGINIRCEGIDALETHYTSTAIHQNISLANSARDRLLSLLGFSDLEYLYQHNPYVVTKANVNFQYGFVLSNGVDGNGRLIGFIFQGKTSDVDPVLAEAEERSKPQYTTGSVEFGRPKAPIIQVSREMIRKSVNFQLIKSGLVYATLYTSLSFEWSRLIAEEIRDQRNASGVGTLWHNETLNTKKVFLWDKTISGLQQTVMFPKLFRRLVEYSNSLSAGRGRDIIGWLNDKNHVLKRNDRLLLPPAQPYQSPPFCDFGNLSDILIITNEFDNHVEIKLKHEPEDLIILPANV